MPSVMQAHFLLDGSAGPGRGERRRPPLVIAHDSDALPPSGSREPTTTLATLLLACLHFFGEVFDGKKHAVCAGYGCTEDSALGGFVTREHRALEAAGMPNVAVRTLLVLPHVRLALLGCGARAGPPMRCAPDARDYYCLCRRSSCTRSSCATPSAPRTTWPRVATASPRSNGSSSRLPARPSPLPTPRSTLQASLAPATSRRRSLWPMPASWRLSTSSSESTWPAGRGGRRTTWGRVGAVAVSTRI
jgi:hypothetical protein